nr:hypothetical protein [uncultured Rhodopila sp.]
MAIAFFGHAPVGIWHDLKVLTFFVALFVLIALAPAYLTVRAETASPLDDYLQRTSRTARPRLEEGMGLIPELDSKLGRWYPGLFAPDFHDSRFANLVTFALGTWFGVVTTSMRPDRLTSLVHLRRHGQQRELLCYGLGRVIIGRPASDLEPVPLTHNARFIALYFGHALATFGGIMVAVVALVFANYTGLSEHEGNPMRVLSGAVLLWWSLMLLYAFSACSRDIAILREDLVNTRSSPYLPTSLQDWHSIEPLLGLLDAATVNWIPKTVGLASTVMLVAALAAIQALEAAP